MMGIKRIDREAIRQAIADEAAYWDATDTADLMAQETDWLQFEWTPREDRCDRCGAKMQSRQVDLRLSNGKVISRGATWYTCRTPGCGQTRFAPIAAILAEEFRTLGERSLVTAALREGTVKYSTSPAPANSSLLTIRGVFDGRRFRPLPTEALPSVQYEIPVAIVFLEGASPELSEHPTECQPHVIQLGMDKDEQKRRFDHLFAELSIKGAPIGAEILQQRMREAGLDSTELSRGIIEAREE